jgi:hypothetical protein
VPRPKQRRETRAAGARAATPATLAALPDDELLEHVQRQTFRYFWDGAEARTALAFDRRRLGARQTDHKLTTGGSGFGIMALLVAAQRGWISRQAALQRLDRMLEFLLRATCYHGVFPHFIDARSGATIPMWRKDDGADLVETSFLCMGLLCARQYFDADESAEIRVRARISWIWEEVEWNWHTQDGRKLLYWHWSPNNGWAMDHEIRGWDECLITYVLAASAPRYPIDPIVYHRGFAGGRNFINGRSYFGIALPLGVPQGGPLFHSHYSFCGLDPRGLTDRYADYWQQNVNHVRINHAHCVANPHRYVGYGPDCWGLTASDDPDGYIAHAPDNDTGTIAPTAALASMPYEPQLCLQALRHFLRWRGGRLWQRYGFIDAFSETREWFADTFLAIDQGPIIIMIENYRSGLLWKLFMSVPEVQLGLRRLGFSSPHLQAGAASG